MVYLSEEFYVSCLYYTGCFKMNSGVLTPHSIYYIKPAVAGDVANEREIQTLLFGGIGAHAHGMFLPQSSIKC